MKILQLKNTAMQIKSLSDKNSSSTGKDKEKYP